MSKKGYRSDKNTEGDRGFFRACSTETILSESLKDMGQNYRINETFISPMLLERHPTVRLSVLGAS